MEIQAQTNQVVHERRKRETISLQNRKANATGEPISNSRVQKQIIVRNNYMVKLNENKKAIADNQHKLEELQQQEARI